VNSDDIDQIKARGELNKMEADKSATLGDLKINLVELSAGK